MNALRLRWYALVQYRYLPYVLTVGLVMLSNTTVEAHDEELFGWVCFICGCGWLGSHLLPPPWGCWFGPNPAGCWIHPSDNCIYIKAPLEA